MRKSKYTLLYYIGLCGLLLCAACKNKTIYSHYEHVPIFGWEKNDTLFFAITPIKQDGNYQENIGIRINGSYPFMGLTLIAEQTIFPSMESHSDTLNYELIDEDGNMKGKGISHYQYSFPLKTLQLQEGDSVSINIRHDMKREILPGVSDIGITLIKESSSRASQMPTGINTQEDK